MFGMNPMKWLPDSWKTDATVVRGGGRDSRGNPLPPKTYHIKRVLVGQATTNDPVDNSDKPNSRTLLYTVPDPEVTLDGVPVEDFRFESTDVIVIPKGARMAGRWSVDGDPGEWPFGNHLTLVRA